MKLANAQSDQGYFLENKSSEEEGDDCAEHVERDGRDDVELAWGKHFRAQQGADLRNKITTQQKYFNGVSIKHKPAQLL